MNKEQYFQALELDAKRLSLEAFGQDAVNNLIYKYIPQTFENFLGYVNSFWLITKHKAIPDIYKSQERREFSKLVLSQPYTVLANMDVIVPEGVIISGSDYSDTYRYHTQQRKFTRLIYQNVNGYFER